mmetsp:Transcript_52325/g.167802  ORF Transcript_52325/g.167802 Transcript_52325/m.167802 type:complete len:311 (+) Transcript_52325:262-1194(+)
MMTGGLGLMNSSVSSPFWAFSGPTGRGFIKPGLKGAFWPHCGCVDWVPTPAPPRFGLLPASVAAAGGSSARFTPAGTGGATATPAARPPAAGAVPLPAAAARPLAAPALASAADQASLLSHCAMYSASLSTGVAPFTVTMLKLFSTYFRLGGVSCASISFVRVGSSRHFETKRAICRRSAAALLMVALAAAATELPSAAAVCPAARAVPGAVWDAAGVAGRKPSIEGGTTVPIGRTMPGGTELPKTPKGLRGFTRPGLAIPASRPFGKAGTSGIGTSSSGIGSGAPASLRWQSKISMSSLMASSCHTPFL